MPRVRDLDWQVDFTDGEETRFADSVLGRYCAWVRKGVAYVVIPGASRPEPSGETIEDALRHAQADFERKVLSALA